jgi:nicotinate-nucleotide pyrophosphorylase
VSDASGTPVLDRITIMPVVMQALLDDDAHPSGDPEEVGVGRVVARSAGTLAGMPVAKEAFGRMGVRCRASVSEGMPIVDGDQVAELGGPVAAMRGAAPTALRFLSSLSEVASGRREPEPGDPFGDYALALRLSGQDPVGHDGPSFALEI